jgi:hypothetical protein
MSEYKGIKGFQVQTRSEDPVPYAQALEDNPYAGSWASGGDLPQANRSMGLFGTYTSAVVAGGYINPPGTSLEADSYNGTSWSEIAELNSAKNESQGFGNSATSGYLIKDTTEFWNGSTWTEVSGDLVTARGLASVTGTSTAAILGGGEAGPPARNLVEQWDGSSWTEVAEINTNREAGSAMSGTSTAAIISVGYTGTANTTNSETWNGSSWTEGSDANLARQRVGYAGSTVPTALIIGGLVGTPSPTTVTGNTESYDGTSWSEVNNLATARRSLGSGKAGTGTNALAVGGLTPPVTTATEEWAFSGLDPSTTPAADYANAIVGDFYYNSSTGQYKTVNDGGAPIGTWSSGNNLNTARDNMAGAGTQTSAMSVNGSNPPPTNISNVENYDGTSWAETTENNTPRRYGTANGPSGNTSVIYIGGYGAPPVANIGNTEIWNGSSWSETGDLDKGRNNLASAGTTTANVAFGGETNPPFGGASQAYTELFDGSSWTEVNALNEGRNSKAGAGTSGAAISVDEGGTTNVELWDGTSWAETTDYNTTRGGAVTGPSSPQSDVLLMTGQTPGGFVANCEHWNGTTWTEVADVATAMTRGGGAGLGGTSGLKFGGSTPSNTAATEEFTAADFQIKSVTTS